MRSPANLEAGSAIVVMSGKVDGRHVRISILHAGVCRILRLGLIHKVGSRVEVCHVHDGIAVVSRCTIDAVALV